MALVTAAAARSPMPDRVLRHDRGEHLDAGINPTDANQRIGDDGVVPRNVARNDEQRFAGRSTDECLVERDEVRDAIELHEPFAPQ